MGALVSCPKNTRQALLSAWGCKSIQCKVVMVVIVFVVVVDIFVWVVVVVVYGGSVVWYHVYLVDFQA